MKVLLTGGTGLIGRHLVNRLVERGDECVVLVRKPVASYRPRQGVTYLAYVDLPLVQDVDAVVNMAGEWIAGIWTPSKRKRILGSRVETTRLMVEWMANQNPRPKTFLSGSAVGIYGDRPGEVLTEDSPTDPAYRFRCEVCRAWEAEASNAEPLGIRTVFLRIGNVVAPNEGLLGALIPRLRRFPFLIPFQEGTLNPWIALPDAIRLIELALDDQTITGPFNVVGPSKATTRQLMQEIGRLIHRQTFGQIPNVIPRLFLGEFARSFTETQDVRPAKAMAAGFVFEHRDLAEALAERKPTRS